MKKFVTVLALAAVTTAGIQTASAHGGPGPVVGGVLAGLVVGSVVAHATAPPPPVVYTAPAPVYYSAPAPVVATPAPVYYNSYVAPAPVYTAPAPVYVAPAPVYCPPPVVVGPPVVRFGFGFGHPRHFHHRW